MTDTKTLGFIGLGVMGEPICRNLVKKSGKRVVVFDLSAEPLQRLRADGAEVAGSVADVIKQSDVLFLFPDIDSPDIVGGIGYRPEFETIHYVSGALISNGTRENRPKSSLVKLIGTPLYRRMTIRNVTTARKLAELVQ